MIPTLIPLPSLPGVLAAQLNGFDAAPRYVASYTSTVGIESVYGEVTLSSDAVNCPVVEQRTTSRTPPYCRKLAAVHQSFALF